MAEQIDASQGWCCDGRTWKEHAAEDDHCCQPRSTAIADLPAEGQRAAQQRIDEAGGGAAYSPPEPRIDVHQDRGRP